MSYILDALRKADAQRERDASRGIHAQPAAPAGVSSSPASRWVGWGAAVAGIAAIVVAGVYFTRSPERAAAPVAAPAALPPAAMQPATPVAMQTPQEVAKSISPPPEPASPQRDSSTMMPRLSADDRARMAREAAFGRAPRGPAPVQPSPAPQVAQAAPQSSPAPGITGLPPDAPRIAISGGVYSPSPAQRMLIVNGQVFNEGSEVAPGLTIERIEPKAAVLKFRGATYSVSY